VGLSAVGRLREYGRFVRIRASAVVLVGLFAGMLVLAGCGGGSEPTDGSDGATPSGSPAGQKPVGSGAAVAKCQQAMLGKGRANWRDDSTHVGPVGFFGSGRDFRGLVGHIVKTPVVVEGRKAVTLAIDPAQRDRAGLLIVGGGRHGYAKVRFLPCRDRVRTAWPAGFHLRGTDPVVVIVRIGKKPASRLEVGRP
jgi:hypothetical protein